MNGDRGQGQGPTSFERAMKTRLSRLDPTEREPFLLGMVDAGRHEPDRLETRMMTLMGQGATGPIEYVRALLDTHACIHADDPDPDARQKGRRFVLTHPFDPEELLDWEPAATLRLVCMRPGDGTARETARLALEGRARAAGLMLDRTDRCHTDDGHDRLLSSFSSLVR